jgi:hypothetical protein
MSDSAEQPKRAPLDTVPIGNLTPAVHSVAAQIIPAFLADAKHVSPATILRGDAAAVGNAMDAVVAAYILAARVVVTDLQFSPDIAAKISIPHIVAQQQAMSRLLIPGG